MFKRWFYKRQLKKWKGVQETLELLIEYAYIPDEEEIERYKRGHEDCTKIIEGLELLIEYHKNK